MTDKHHQENGMASYTGPPPFDEATDEWPAHQVRLEAFFEGHGVTEEKKKRALLVAALSTNTVGVIAGRCAPAKVNELSYTEVVALLQQYFSPEPNEIAQSYKFFTRNQSPGEPVKEFLLAIRQIANTCNFGDSLDRMLRDRIVCGLQSSSVRRQLLAKTGLTRSEAEEIALAAELAVENERGIGAAKSDENVYAVTEKGAPREGRRMSCFRCGGQGHSAETCRFRSAICYKCRQRGHLARVCSRRADKLPTAPRVSHQDVSMLEPKDDDAEADGLFMLGAAEDHVGSLGTVKPLVHTLEWGGVPVTMQLDTGSPVSLITWPTYIKHRAAWPKLQDSALNLTCFLGKLPVSGQLKLNVSTGGRSVAGTLTVLGCKGPNLCGRDLIQTFDLLNVPVCNVSAKGEPITDPVEKVDVQDLLKEFPDVFKPGLGLIKGPPAHLRLKETAVARFCKARQVPYALRSKVAAEIDRLVENGILKPVPHSEWAAPVVPVVKRNGSIRLCGDFKVTVNQACLTAQYPLPRVDDILATLNGGEVFTTIDLRDAYNQLPLDEESQLLTTVNTQKGLFCFTRLPFGVSSAPALFQSRMEAILQGLPGVQVYLDDVIVAEKKNDCATLRKVLERFQQSGVRLHPDKSKFRQPEVDFLGHRISAHGVQPKTENIDAILEVKEPQSAAELRSFLGLVTYYHKFLKNASSVMAPLYELLRTNVKWRWGCPQQVAFDEVKTRLKEAEWLAHFDGDKPLILECDASPVGIGAVLSHDVGQGVLRPVGFRSRILTQAERNYSQLEREALALVFGVLKFRAYLLGRVFTLITDHKPLVGLFHPDKSVPAMAAGRIQRWALILSAYSYNIQHKDGKANVPADALSRIPVSSSTVPEESEDCDGCEYVLLTNSLNDGVISAKQLAALTSKDRELTKVRKWVQEGWPRRLARQDELLKVFFNRKDELTVSQGLVYWGHRVVVPIEARSAMLHLLHDTHQGIGAMKALARSLFWYPRIDADIERLVKSCQVCVQAAPMPPRQEAVPWPETGRRWSRLHIDFAGPVEGYMLMILVDAHTKWIEVVPMKSATACSTIEALRTTFSRFGIPETIVSDNGPQFTGKEFADFMRRNNVLHLRTAPYHPQSNGLAERAVRTVKQKLKTNRQGSLQTRLARILHSYRRTPLACGETPAMRLLGFQPRSRLDNAVVPLAPVERSPCETDVPGFLQTGDPVWVRNFGQGEPWTRATIRETQGARMVTADGATGEIIRRHLDQVKVRLPDSSLASSPVPCPTDVRPESNTGRPEPEDPPAAGSPASTDLRPLEATPTLRRSTRIRRPPERFSP
ncbi:uncharacterized protein K02A2.6-like [Dermacentor silvarum]|uniref:uncharacterized protein K02A2.6-like n=1 Tax=Dermacentor silvarum TaxID=543639 RepID=UPI0021018053|nr:uncharacterized protein K02A2.6-like [Dermacentor silvarum]